MIEDEIDADRRALETYTMDGYEAEYEELTKCLDTTYKSCLNGGHMSHTDTWIVATRKAAHKIIQGHIRDGWTNEKIAARYDVTANGVENWRGGGKPSFPISEKIVAMESVK